MESSFTVVATRDGGYECWDTTISAREIARMMASGMLEYDPDHQRGRNSVTGKYVVKKDKVERWARALQDDTAIFGQLTWNFRPEETGHIAFQAADDRNPLEGKLVVEDGAAKLPDSYHRHLAIKEAVESVSRGSSFDPSRRFSLRIWSVPEEFEDVIFNAMNTEHDKADATRSKYLHQRGAAQRLARELVRQSPHLGEGNVETVSNTVSVRNPRLAAFNTFSSAFEESRSPWAEIDMSEVDAAVSFLVQFWDKLTEVIPALGVLLLAERQKARKESLAGSAIAIHGYIRLAYRLYPDGDLDVLERLSGKITAADGSEVDFFDSRNPAFKASGVVVPSVKDPAKLTPRSSYATHYSMGEIFAERCGLTA